MRIVQVWFGDGRTPLIYTLMHRAERLAESWGWEYLCVGEPQGEIADAARKVLAKDEVERSRALADIARAQVLAEGGGLYLDADAEVLRPDALRDFCAPDQGFLARQKVSTPINGIIWDPDGRIGREYREGQRWVARWLSDRPARLWPVRATGLTGVSVFRHLADERVRVLEYPLTVCLNQGNQKVQEETVVAFHQKWRVRSGHPLQIDAAELI